MNVFEELEEMLDNTFKEVIAALSTFAAAVDEEYAFFDCVEKDIEYYKKEGILVCSFQNDTCASKRSSSLKENVQTNERNSKRRTRRNIEKANILSNVSNLVEHRVDKLVADVQIKIERTSRGIANEVTIKQEGDMLPPQNKRVPKRRANEVKLECVGDSIIEPKDSVGVIVGPDSEVRVTRARTKGRAKPEVPVDLDVRQVKSEKTRTKSKREKHDSKSSQSAIIEEDKNADRLSQKQNLISVTNDGVETIQAVEFAEQNSEHEIIGLVAETNCNTFSNPAAAASTPHNVDDLTISDKESPQCTSRPRKVTQFFTPSASTPIAKCSSKATLSRKGLPSELTRNPKLQNSSLRDSKLKFLQTSAKKASAARARTGSALKASQIEFREREMRRKQKEEEASRKKQALILAQTEGRRLRREERELKVQQLKMDMEKEKQRQLKEAEKAREEKFKQILAEKEARFFKQKEEAARKRAAAAQKLDNMHQEDTPKLTPVFLTCPAPLLPTPDCYDSDDSTGRGTFVIPEFQKKDNLKKTLFQMQMLNSCTKPLFLRSFESPNLLKIFPAIKASQLKRTSSAIWNRTEMSVIDSFLEECS
ncbi:DNA ligase 1-like [Photinus pyralis]|uniref:Inner centromere protein ARK-binding domain-containing protein n=1 Tax=Photinus pyralis TaxID=7054 RepID=A0A1Y1LJL1_PHOPY|nr:DNA ligase 1-like [Photinus pyralis]